MPSPGEELQQSGGRAGGREPAGQKATAARLQPAPERSVVVGGEGLPGERAGAVRDEHVPAVHRVHPVCGHGRAHHRHAQLVRCVDLALDAGTPPQRRHRQPHPAVEGPQVIDVAVDHDARRRRRRAAVRGAVELQDGGRDAVGADHVEDEARVARSPWVGQDERQHVVGEEEDGVAVGQVVEVAYEDDAGPLAKRSRGQRGRLVRVGDDHHGRRSVTGAPQLVQQSSALALADDDRGGAAGRRPQLAPPHRRALSRAGPSRVICGAGGRRPKHGGQ
eukprot:scaffold30345_cov90-Isochrysis_galbana.AAC.2